MESRFAEREWLSRYSLDVSLFDCYDFTVEDVVPLRKVFILVTDKGNKIFKKTTCGDEELSFMYFVIDYLKKNGFDKIMSFVPNKAGHISTRWKEDTYIVMDMLDGREADYSNPLDVVITTASLVGLHKSSMGIRIPENSERFGGGKLIDSFRSKAAVVENIKNEISLYGNRNEFEEIFLNNYDSYRADMEKSIDILEHSAYRKLCEDKNSYVLCHNDLAYHNILIRDNVGWFVDLDYSAVDIRVRDVCNLINKVTKYSCYSTDNLKLIMDVYQNKDELSKEELEVLYGLLCFPDGFCSIVDSYFYKKKLWPYESFMYKINKKVENIDERHEMLNNFKTQYLSATF